MYEWMDTNFYLTGICLILLAFCAWRDWKEQRIPNSYLMRGIAIRILLLLHEISVGGVVAIGMFVERITAAIVIFAIGMVIRRVTKDGIGMGDLKLLAVMYLYLEPKTWLTSLGISFCLGGVFALFWRLRGKKCEKIPFAPFLLLGSILAVICFFY